MPTLRLLILFLAVAAAVAQAQGDPFQRGQDAWRREEWAEALQGFQQVTRSGRGPHLQEASYKVAACLHHLERDDQAGQALDDWLPEAPATVWKARGYVLQGTLERRPQDFTRALQVLDRTGGDRATRLQALLERGRLLASRRPVEAEADLVQVIRQDFRGPRGAEARMALADLYLQNPQVYDQTVDRAVDVWRELVQTTPASPLAPEARLRSAQAFSSAENHVAALEDLEALTRDYPRSPEAREAARLLDEIRLPVIELASERSFRPGEPPRVHLRTRNVPEVELTAWPIELLDAFARTRNLDEVSRRYEPTGRPAARWLHAVPDWRDHRWSDAEVEVPLEAPGAYVVIARDGELRSSALLLVSRLALVFLDSPGGAPALWAVDAVEGRAAGGARVVRADGWGETGFSHLTALRVEAGGLVGLPPSSDGPTLVLARRGADYALVQDRGAPAPPEDWLTFLYTDRPLYRPGDRVSWKAVVRARTPMGYDTPAGERFRVKVQSPRGDTALDTTLTATSSGTLSGSLEIPTGAPTGAWTVTLESGERVAGFSGFRVEEYRKPDFLVTVRPEPGRATVEARYPFGQPVAGGRASWTVTRRPVAADLTPHPGLSWFLEATPPTEVTVASGQARLDDHGRTALAFPVREDGLYTVRVVVTDASQRRVEGSASVGQGLFMGAWSERWLWSPGQDVEVRVQAVDPTGRAHQGEVTAVLLSDRDRTQPQIPVERLKLDAEGRATFRWRPGQEGRYYVRFTAGGASTEATVQVGVAGLARPDRSGGLQVLPDRTLYRPGETARLLLRTPEPDMHVLLSFEGEEVVRRMVVSCPGVSTSLDVPLGPDLSPNVWIRAVAVRDFAVRQDEREILVPDPDGVLQVRVEPAGARAGRQGPVTVSVRDGAGRPVVAELSLAVRDAATPDRGPSIESWFHGGRRDHAVALRSSFDFALRGPDRPETPKWEEKPGDAEGPPASRPAPPRTTGTVPETVLWTADLRTGPDGTAQVQVPWPDRPATWSVLARAVTPGTRVGQGAAQVEIRKDLALRLAAPRFLTQGDLVRLRATVHNARRQGLDVRLSLTSSGLRVEEPARSSLGVPASGQAAAEFTALAPSGGHAGLALEATAPGESDSLSLTLPVVPHGVEKVHARAGQVERGASASFLVPPERAVETTRLEVAIASSLAGSLAGPVQGLLEHPAGSVEQSVSRFVPGAVFRRAFPEGLRDLEPRIREATHEGLRRLADQQGPNGAWGWWRGGDDDPAMTAYVLDGLARAREAGVEVPEALASRGLFWLRNRLPGLRADERARALHALAGWGQAPEKALSDLQKQRLDETSAFLLAAALGRQGRADEGRTLLRAARPRREAEAGTASFGSEEATAFALEAWLALAPEDPLVPQMARWLASRRQGDRWGSTRETARSVLALAAFARRHEAAPSDFSFGVWVNGVEVETGRVTSREPWKVRRVSLAGPQVPEGEVDLEIRRTGQGPAWWTAVLSYRTREEPIRAGGHQAGLERKLFKIEPGGRRTALKDGAVLRAGDVVESVLDLEVEHPLRYLRLEDFRAAGLEPLEAASGPRRFGRLGAWQEVREDRLVLYLASVPPGRHRLTWRMRAEIPGEFHALPARVEGVYHRDVRAWSAEWRVTVR